MKGYLVRNRLGDAERGRGLMLLLVRRRKGRMPIIYCEASTEGPTKIRFNELE